MAEWLVKYDGNCARCGLRLVRGTPAVWDRARHELRCIECPTEPDAGSPAVIESGVGGGSARREYQRRRAKREAAIEERWGRFSGLVKAFTSEPLTTTAWAIGAEGEERLAAALQAVPGLRVLNDRRVRGTRGNIDHLVVGPAGVFVVDAKNYSGTVRFRDVGGLFRRDVRLWVGRRDRSTDARDMAWQVEVVRGVFGSPSGDAAPPIYAVLCFTKADWPIFRSPDVFEGVLLESVDSLKKIVSNPVVFTPAEVDDLARLLASAFPPK